MNYWDIQPRTEGKGLERIGGLGKDFPSISLSLVYNKGEKEMIHDIATVLPANPIPV